MRTQDCFKLLILLFITITFLQLNSAFTKASPPTQSDPCKLNPTRDLSGDLTDINLGVITNSSSICSYTVGLASYRKFDNTLANQQIFDWETKVVGPGETIQLEVDLPTCAAQVDLFFGPVLFAFDSGRYKSRLLAVHHRGGNDFCLRSAPTCAVYAVDRPKGNQSQLLTIDLRARKTYSFGPLHQGHDITGFAFEPVIQTLFAISRERSELTTKLYTVDRNTGVLNLIGDTGFDNVRGLTFHPAAATFWSWVQGTGLIEIDPATATSTIKYTSNLKTDGLAWNNDGTFLYVAEGKSLWRYDPSQDTLEKISTNLPSGTEALEIRPDSLLLGSRDDSNKVHLFAYDVTTQQVVMDRKIDSKFDHIQAIAWLGACGNPSPGGEVDLIQQVTLDKTKVCVGESLLVTVSAQHPESPQNTVDISINGQSGSSRYLQFTGEPGKRYINITAATPEKYIDRMQKQVEVIACNENQVFPILAARPNPYYELTVDLDILNGDEFDEASPTYVWEFGDGQTEQTTTSFVTHDYSNAISRDQFYTVFQARVTVQRNGQPDVSTPKSLTIWNTYALNKKKGVIQPRITSDAKMELVNGKYIGAYTIKNLENESIQFTSRQFEYQFCDPEQHSTPLAPESYQLTIGGQQEVNLQIEIPSDSVSADICGVAVYLTGQTASQVKAYASLYFDLQNNPIMTQPITDPALLQLLNDIVARGLAVDQYHISEEDLYRLKRAGEIDYPPPPVTSSSVITSLIQSTTPFSDDAIAQLDDVIGQPCTPGDPPPRPGVSCQATGEWTFAPPRIANARKGDIILSAGCGVIGDLLRQVSPPQRYSHTGIMTKDYYELRHSTASTKRYGDYGVGFTSDGSDGIRTDVVKFGWPGTITQSIDEAFNGEIMLDPEGKSYNVEGFAADPVRCSEDLIITYPGVVKPPPGHDPYIRERLHDVADTAMNITGHYRFFAYTNAAISEDKSFNAPADAGWAENSIGSVCTSFIWTALRKTGTQVEGLRLEPEDFSLGAEQDPGMLDGLYFYTEAERKAGGDWLYHHFYNLAYEQAGWLGRLFTDAPDDVANQVANCFANDSCNKDSEAWKNPGVGRAVSPDNILLYWDAPETGGVYGFNEPIVYRAGDYIQLSRWQASPGVGSITGRVLLEGTPIEGASVTILGVELFTNANGQFRDDLIPAGTYEIEASKSIDGIFYSTHQTVTINPDALTNVELVLQPPANIFRQVIVQGNMFIVDGEVFGDNETANVPIFGSKNLSPFNRRENMHFEGCAGDEVRIELDIALRLESDNITVAASGEARMYEESDCDNDDFEDSKTFLNTIPMNQSVAVNIDLRNEDIVDDTADIDFTIFNGQQGQTFLVHVPSTGGELKAGDIADFNFPADTFTDTVTITYSGVEPFGTSPHVGIFYDIRASMANDNSSVEITPRQNYAVTINYKEPLIPTDMEEANLALFYWDGATWIPEPTSEVDIVNDTITATPNHFSIWAVLFKSEPTVLYLPLIFNSGQ